MNYSADTTTDATSAIRTVRYEASKTNPGFTFDTEGSSVANVFHDSIKGKTILITGVRPGGLGATMAMILATHEPSLLILTGRSIEKTEAVAKEITTNYAGVKIRILKLDLASIAATEEAAREVISYPEPCIDILINNSGVMSMSDRVITNDGYELHIQTNFISPFKFICKIMSKMLASESGRIVNVVSNTYVLSPVRFSDLNFTGQNLAMDEVPNKEVCKLIGILPFPTYIPQVAFAQSKTAVLLGTKILADKLRGRVTVLFASPGIMDLDFYKEVHFPSAQSFAGQKPKTRSQGAAPVLVAALDPDLAETYASTKYFSDSQLKDTKCFSNAASSIRKLWDLIGESSASWDYDSCRPLEALTPSEPSMPPIADEEPEDSNFEDLYADDAQHNEKKVSPHFEDETTEDGSPSPELAEPASETLWFLEYPPPPPPAPPTAMPTNPPARKKAQALAPVKRSERIAGRQNSIAGPEAPKRLYLASRVTTTNIDSGKDSREESALGISIRGRARKGRRGGSGQGAGSGRSR